MTDGVLLHVQAIKELPWDSLADGWPAAADGGGGSAQEVQALHEAYVERFDAFRDPERGARMQAAIVAVGERAEAGEAVSWEGLCAVQGVVLAQESVGFRSGPAYANSRMETYAFHPRLQGVLSKKLAKDEGDALHPLLKACRTYLDVRFFHPFADGNSGAARLAFQWIAQRGAVRLTELTPLFRMPIGPGDAEQYRGMIDLAGSLLAR